ncbi:hypothetical protein [Neobacillus sp. DY30]|uniref:hypothetical protein n=1 Tax=Neobacillus sp. DY30 TaxID=3047871 RepID=UPI0024BF52CA|nr:hypothetical protein [Neobacillus sp. DY30]WHY00261.1 hypothetical protein QNH29_27655 [Neobacillus sp. DY30]
MNGNYTHLMTGKYVKELQTNLELMIRLKLEINTDIPFDMSFIQHIEEIVVKVGVTIE